MAITQLDKIVRVSFVFAMEGDARGTEVIVTSANYRAASVPGDPVVLKAILQDMATAACASVVANVDKTWYPSGLVGTHVRVALEDNLGHTLEESIVGFSGALTYRGQSGGACLPWQIAFVLSLYAYQPTNFDPLGRFKRGRMYLPAPTASMLGDGTGEISESNMTLMVNGWGQVLQELQQHDYSGFPAFAPVLGINSKTTPKSKPGKVANFYPVTWLRADTKLDTQRRRSNRQLASTAEAPYPHA